MPYSTLPERLLHMIPSPDGQELFRVVLNSQLTIGKSNTVATASAWAALKEAGYNNVGGLWVQKNSGKAIANKVEEYNEKYGAKHGRVTASMLRTVYDRGLAAYREQNG